MATTDRTASDAAPPPPPSSAAPLAHRAPLPRLAPAPTPTLAATASLRSPPPVLPPSNESPANLADHVRYSSGQPLARADVPAAPDQAGVHFVPEPGERIIGDVGASVRARKVGVVGPGIILLAYDGSEHSDRAFEYLLSDVAKPDDHIFLVTVLPASIINPEVSQKIPAKVKEALQREDEALEELREEAVAKLYKLEDRLLDLHIATTLHILHGEPRAAILRVARYHQVDLIVVGRRRLGVKRPFTSGTCSNYLVAHAEAPVLIVK